MERGHESTPLQEVMSPTLGPASGMLNGANTTVDNSLPNQTGELAGNGVQQATVMTSGPSTSAAVQIPSPMLPRDDRTGGDGTSGQLVLCMVQCLQRKLLMRVGCMEM